jgi:Protein of unknown function (DUF1580)
MIDISKEQVMPLSRAASKHVPPRRRGKPTHTSTLYRWSDPGLHGIRLEVLRCGGVLCTSVEALQRFFDRLTAIKSARVLPSQDRPAAGAADVDQRLDEMGF